ncbi:MAG: hypothetical protein JKY81_05535 [Colwellia sp.]|nr:hypothetical protein [Colwellia sp.]
MDLTTIEGITFTPEQTAAIMKQHQTGIDAATTGLVNKNNELLGEKKTAMQSVSDADLALTQAREVATKAEEDRLKLAGDVEGLKSHYENQLAEATANANTLAKTAQDALLSRDKGSVMSQVLGLIHDDYKGLAEAQLSNMLEIGYNDQQQPTTVFKDKGVVVANNVDEFKSWAAEQPQFKRILNGVDSSGADTTQSRASGSTTNKEYKNMSIAEQTAYLKTVNPQRN